MMRLKYSTVTALARIGPANCVGSAGSSADSRGARDFGSSRFMPSSGTSRSKCGLMLALSGRRARSKENYHLRGNLRHDWEGTGQGEGYLEHTLGYEFKPWPKRPCRVHVPKHHAEEEYENDRIQAGGT